MHLYSSGELKQKASLGNVVRPSQKQRDGVWLSDSLPSMCEALGSVPTITPK